jgi:hypothetical protein
LPRLGTRRYRGDAQGGFRGTRRAGSASTSAQKLAALGRGPGSRGLEARLKRPEALSGFAVRAMRPAGLQPRVVTGRRPSVAAALQSSDFPSFPGREHSLPLLLCGRARVYAHHSLFLYTIASTLISLVRPRDETLVTLIVNGPVLWLSVLAHELAKGGCLSS